MVRSLELRLHEETVIEGMAIPVADARQQVEIARGGWAEGLAQRRIAAAMRIKSDPFPNVEKGSP